MPAIDPTDLFSRLARFIRADQTAESDAQPALQELTAVHEDFLSTCFAHALEQDPELARRFIAQLLARRCPTGFCAADARVRVSTQNEYELGRPDIELVVTSSAQEFRIIVEVKLDAALGPAQLERYRSIDGVWGVALITRKAQTVNTAEEYPACLIAPVGARAYFTWGDFAEMVSECGGRPDAPVLSRALKGLFYELRLLRPPALGEIGRAGTEDDQAAWDRYSRALPRTVALLQRRGWMGAKIHKKAQVYSHGRALQSTGTRLTRVTVSPLSKSKYPALRLILDFHSDAALSAALDAFRAAPPAHPAWAHHTVPPASAWPDREGAYVIDVPRMFFEPEGVTDEQRAASIAEYVEAVIAVADGGADHAAFVSRRRAS